MEDLGVKIEELRIDVQDLYHLKDQAGNSPDHVGVFTTLRGATLDEALRRQATFILGSPMLSRRIQQDRKFHSLFNVASGVKIYDRDGEESELVGLIGYLGVVPVHIHPLNAPWVHPTVDQGFKEWDLIYMYPKSCCVTSANKP